MSQAAKKTIKITSLVVTILCILSLGVGVLAAYLNTNRDTRKAPAKATEKVDLAVALVMALDRAIRNSDATTSIYEERGLLFI